jgi:hypothetical protein
LGLLVGWELIALDPCELAEAAVGDDGVAEVVVAEVAVAEDPALVADFWVVGLDCAIAKLDNPNNNKHNRLKTLIEFWISMDR